MKKVFKILGILVGIVILLIIAGYIYLNTAFPKVDPPKDIKVEATPERIARGEYIAHHVAVCIVRSANITPDAETGIGNWTKEVFFNRFKFYANEEAHNVPVNIEKEFNTPTPWLMYAGMNDEDLGAIYDYLKTVTPVKNKVERFTPHTTASK